MTSTSDEVGHTATPALTVKLEGVGTNPNVGDWCVMRGSYYYACECALKDAEEIANAVNSHDSLVKALERIAALGSKKVHQSGEIDDLYVAGVSAGLVSAAEIARVALSQAKE